MTNASPQISPELGTGAHDILLVGRDLGSEEVKQGRPFANMSKFSGAGYVLNKALGEAGIRRKDLLGITNVVMRKPPGNNFHAHSQAALDRGQEEMWALIDELEPNLIVSLGNVAARALISDWPTKKNRPDKLVYSKGIRDRRGFVYEGDHGGKVLATIHPSAIQRGAWIPFRLLLTEDFKKAKQEAQFAEFRWPKREIEVVA